MTGPAIYIGSVPGKWTDRAACKLGNGHDPDLWHTEGRKAETQAKAICKTECPVIAECAEHAFANDERIGVWGGMDEGERKRIRNRRARARRTA